MKTGQAVVNSNGTIGIVTEDEKKSGPDKGKVTVMFVGGSWEVAVRPEDLTAVTVVRDTV